MTYINFISKPFAKNAQLSQLSNPFITQKFIRECPYIGTKICDSFYYFKTRSHQDTLPNNPMIGYFKHNIKRKFNTTSQMHRSTPNMHSQMHRSTPNMHSQMHRSKLDCSFTLDTFINVGKNL
jgi:hypothetical protein